MIKLRHMLMGSFLLLALPAITLAQDEPPLLVESQFFSIHAESSTDYYSFLSGLNHDYFLQFDSLFATGGTDVNSLIAKSVDAIFLETSEILGVSATTYKGKLFIYSDQRSLSEAFYRMFQTEFDEPAFYYHPHNTVYVAADKASLAVVSHEISHAIISHYFVVPPPPKIQEVLSGYVEFRMRKKTKTLPEKYQ